MRHDSGDRLDGCSVVAFKHQSVALVALLPLNNVNVILQASLKQLPRGRIGRVHKRRQAWTESLKDSLSGVGRGQGICKLGHQKLPVLRLLQVQRPTIDAPERGGNGKPPDADASVFHFQEIPYRRAPVDNVRGGGAIRLEIEFTPGKDLTYTREFVMLREQSPLTPSSHDKHDGNKVGELQAFDETQFNLNFRKRWAPYQNDPLLIVGMVEARSKHVAVLPFELAVSTLVSPVGRGSTKNSGDVLRRWQHAS
jgi:hypothetical protein